MDKVSEQTSQSLTPETTSQDVVKHIAKDANGKKVYPYVGNLKDGLCPGGTYELVTDYWRALELLESWVVEPIISSIDIETTGLNPWTDDILLIACCEKNEKHAFVFDVRVLRHQASQFDEIFAQFLRSCRFIIHNAAFELGFFQAHYGVLPKVVFDTQIASQILNAGLLKKNTLEALIGEYIGELGVDKSWQKFFVTLSPASPIPDEAIAYAAGDVCSLYELSQVLSHQLRKKKLWEVWKEIEQPFLHILAESRFQGVGVDVEALKVIREELKGEVTKHIQKFRRATGNEVVDDEAPPANKNVNPASPKQLVRWYGDQGVELDGTSEDILVALLQRKRLPDRVRRATEALLNFRGDSKLLKTYVDAILTKHLNPKTGRIHPEWKQLVDTGRMACKNPNMQNIPPGRIRDAIVAAPGCKLIVADYSGMELRILAQMSGEPAMVEAFQNGEDLHAKTAAAIYQIPVEDVTNEQRQLAKTLNFAMAYGASASRVSQVFECEYGEAEGILKRFFKAYPVLEKYLQRSAQSTQERFVSITPFGRKRFYNPPEPDNPKRKWIMAAIGREGTNAPIQGCNADATKLASIMFRDEINLLKFDAKIVMWVHDEIVVEAEEQYADYAAERLQWCMIEAAKRFLPDVPVEVEPVICERWTK